jgi:hypothetical protein
MSSFFRDCIWLTVVLGNIAMNVVDNVGANWNIKDASPFHGAHFFARFT